MNNLVLLSGGGAVTRKMYNLHDRCGLNVYRHKYHPPTFKRYRFVTKSWANIWRSRRKSTLFINSIIDYDIRWEVHSLRRKLRWK